MERSIEDAFAELAQIEKRMEEEDLPLEDAFALYEKSMAVIKEVSEKIDRVEQKIQMLARDGSLHALDDGPV